MQQAFVVALILGMGLNLSAEAARSEPLKVVSTGVAAKMATEQLIVHSASLDRDMVIEVTRPFASLPAGRKAAAVYLLDGGYDFAGQEGWMLGGAGGMASAFMVSIGYRPADYGRREADLTTQPADHGGHREASRALAFRTFLLGELRPFIEARYAVDPGQAVLVGHSAGGSFAAALFADRPGAFSGYVIGSPAARDEPGLAARVVAAQAGSERIFVAVGEKENATMTAGVTEIAAAFESHRGLAVRSKVFAGATHISYYPELIAEGLAYVLPPTPSAP